MRFSSGAGTTQEAVELVARKLSRIYGLGVTESESLHVWLLEFWEDSTRLRTSVETFVDWLANGSPPWAAYRAFMSGRLITLGKHPGVQPVDVREMQ